MVTNNTLDEHPLLHTWKDEDAADVEQQDIGFDTPNLKTKSPKIRAYIHTVLLMCLAAIITHVLTIQIPHFTCQHKVSHQMWQFGLTAKYMSLDHAYDHLWSNYTDTPILTAEGLESGEAKPGVISMLHQLHCLREIRDALQRSSEGVYVGVDYHDNPHWPHCFDYLRKTILCNADPLIERESRFKNGSLAGGISGSEDLRTCGDFEALFQLNQTVSCANEGICT